VKGRKKKKKKKRKGEEKEGAVFPPERPLTLTKRGRSN